MLAGPPVTGAGGPVSFQYRRGIHEGPAVEIADLLLQTVHQLPQAALDDVVIILPVGILADARGGGVGLRVGVVIIVKQADDRFGPRHQFGRVYALIKMVLHPAHRPMTALVEPRLQPRLLGLHPLGPGNTAEGEPQFSGKGLDL